MRTQKKKNIKRTFYLMKSGFTALTCWKWNTDLTLSPCWLDQIKGIYRCRCVMQISKKNMSEKRLWQITINSRQVTTKNINRTPGKEWFWLTLKAPITTAADDTYKYFFIVFQRKKYLIFHVMRIDMKHQALISLKDKSKKKIVSSAANYYFAL